MITGVVRLSFVHVFEPAQTPSGDMKYSACIMIKKDDKATLKTIDEAIKEATKKGLEKSVFNKTAVPRLRTPLRDGDAEVEEGKRTAEFKGFWFMNASSKNQPGVVDKALKPLFDTNEFYSGVWARVDCNLFPYNTRGNVGIGCGLNNLMKVADDERLDGRQRAEDAFSEFAEAPDAEEGELK